jgi:hypothetical protein
LITSSQQIQFEEINELIVPIGKDIASAQENMETRQQPILKQKFSIKLF